MTSFKNILQLSLLVIIFTTNVFSEEFHFFRLQESVKGSRSIASVGFFDDVETDLYSQVLSRYQDNYEKIGNENAQNVLAQNNFTPILGINNIGFNYISSFPLFKIRFERMVSPNLFDDRWITSDYMTISIDAHKMISKLSNEGEIEITKRNLALFAGVNFVRTFKYDRFKDSYISAMTSDYHKLFFMFNYLKAGQLSHLNGEQIIQKKDVFSFNTGGAFGVPIHTGVNLKTAMMIDFAKSKTTKIHLRDDDKINISSISEKSIKSDLEVKIESDFIKLINLKLLSFGSSYRKSESKRYDLLLESKDLDRISSEEKFEKSIDDVLKGDKINFDILKENLILTEDRISKEHQSRYSFLLLNAKRISKTDHIQVSKSGEMKTFFKHFFSKESSKDNALGRLISSLVKKIFLVSTPVNKDRMERKTLALEYESNENLFQSKKKIDIVDDRKILLDMNINIHISKNIKKNREKYKSLMIDYLKNYTNIKSGIYNLISQNQIVFPMMLNEKISINGKGIVHLNKLGRDKIYEMIKSICPSKVRPVKKHYMRSQYKSCRTSLRRSLDFYFDELYFKKYDAKVYKKCMKNTPRFSRKGRAFYKKLVIKKCQKKSVIAESYEKRAGPTPLWRLSELVEGIFIYSDHINFLSKLFGADNIFYRGKFLGENKNGLAMKSQFKGGVFQGQGPVANFSN